MKVALVELASTHTECMPAQIKFLQDGNCHVTIICTEDIKHRVKPFGANELIVLPPPGLSKASIAKFYEIINQIRFDRVIFNTAQGSLAAIFNDLQVWPKGLTGILHNADRLKRSKRQNRISKYVKKYLVLNDYLLPAKPIKDLLFESFYPIFFDCDNIPEVDKLPNEIWISIPGSIEFKRRDYKGLFRLLRKMKVSRHIKFLLLGVLKDDVTGNFIRKNIKREHLEHQFRVWNASIPDKEYYAYMLASDYVLPLLHKGSRGFNDYKKHKISGAFNMAFGFQKPLIIDQNFKGISDFDENAIFYKKSKLIELLNSLENYDLADLYQDKKWSYEYQKQNYLKFVLD